MQKVCSICGRHTEMSAENEVVDELSVSHGICARCAILQYSDLILGEMIVNPRTGKKVVNDSEAVALIESELNSKIIWQGEDKSIFKPEEQKIYDELLKKVERNIQKRELNETSVGRLNRK
ncbi:MAG: hypothetical protein A2537_00515 [Candidatus Magasanikbacteria bacterium RIFOXYD2_FULL_36_9]|uniref:Uncharacterized protein n=1 Tax=Candidatus Magasanikbacteria bacterium RIFOXYD2_FULL_36_9 TaxID=1798707 RepID=A0A1F6NZ77_9BACT|nr:MAG: hypothetical protein A2537_00515 [Candidatus Magasanikbacteria bacterium RIFOXYD2_FULL_36_9]